MGQNADNSLDITRDRSTQWRYRPIPALCIYNTFPLGDDIDNGTCPPPIPSCGAGGREQHDMQSPRRSTIDHKLLFATEWMKPLESGEIDQNGT